MVGGKMEDKSMIDNIQKAIDMLNDAKALSILDDCGRGMVSPAEAHMYFAIKEAVKLMEMEVKV